MLICKIYFSFFSCMHILNNVYLYYPNMISFFKNVCKNLCFNINNFLRISSKYFERLQVIRELKHYFKIQKDFKFIFTFSIYYLKSHSLFLKRNYYMKRRRILYFIYFFNKMYYEEVPSIIKRRKILYTK